MAGPSPPRRCCRRRAPGSGPRAPAKGASRARSARGPIPLPHGFRRPDRPRDRRRCHWRDRQRSTTSQIDREQPRRAAAGRGSACAPDDRDGCRARGLGVEGLASTASSRAPRASSSASMCSSTASEIRPVEQAAADAGLVGDDDHRDRQRIGRGDDRGGALDQADIAGRGAGSRPPRRSSRRGRETGPDRLGLRA